MFVQLEVTYPDCSPVDNCELAWVSAAQAGDLEAYNQIVLEYQDLLYRTAVRVLGDQDLAADATQEALIAAFQHLSSYRGGSLKAWLLRIVINKCHDLGRRVQRLTARLVSSRPMTGPETEDELAWLSDPGPAVEALVEGAEQQTQVQACLARLPAEYRLLIELVDVEELSYSETARVLQLPIGTVKSRLARGRERLSAELNRLGITP